MSPTKIVLIVLFLSSIFWLEQRVWATPTAQDISRNQITGGNDSINIIATGGSKVLIFRENGLKVQRTAKAVIELLEKSRPDLLEKATQILPGQSSQLATELAVANYAFEIGQYSLSASLYEEIIEQFNLEDIGYNKIEGLVTASYYGSGRHIQGLRFICQQYKFRASWSYRFRHDIHAHMRALVNKFDHDYARKVLKNIKNNKDCQRDDFSEVWIPISLEDMRALEKGHVPEFTSYGFFDEKDAAFANQLLREEGHGFIDFIYFINGNYEKIIQDFPRSYLYDLALLGKVELDDGTSAISVLDTFLSKYPQSDNFDYALRLIFERAYGLGV
ncbi:tetratricopeptide repeat protein [Kiloniella sp.]|uniref:tetratricopeptide repeat protein n=1 Tax=Kiloniella sp. TaxID=1938587 RepID=UPI003B014258